MNPHINETFENPLITGKVVLARLNEFPDYYTMLEMMEDEAAEFWERQKSKNYVNVKPARPELLPALRVCNMFGITQFESFLFFD